MQVAQNLSLPIAKIPSLQRPSAAITKEPRIANVENDIAVAKQPALHVAPSFKLALPSISKQASQERTQAPSDTIVTNHVANLYRLKGGCDLFYCAENACVLAAALPVIGCDYCLGTIANILGCMPTYPGG